MEPASAPSVAVVAGRYELQGELARGGMGVVYRARDRATNTIVALKRGLSGTDDTVRLNSMLQREYQTLVTLRHPHIIQVFDFGVDEDGPYYTMELLDGVDLRSRCPLPWREVCAYLRDVASSLALLHSRRLIHCDVSVANIRLTKEGRAKLLDFGTLASFGLNSVVAGTPPMIAPEVMEHRELDQRVDLYALGATAYYALCGQHAYPVAMLALLPAAWSGGRPPPPSKYAPDVPPELDELILSLLDLDRMSRPTSAAEVIDRFGAIAGLPPDEDLRVQRSYLMSAEVVGRDSERAQLTERLKNALAGRGGGALISAGAGLGKTFLLEDIVQQARLAGARVLSVSARAHPGMLGAWAALIREARLLSGETVASSLPQASSDGVFVRLSEARPLVLAIEDVHQADPDSLAAYANLAKIVRQHSILLLATLDPSDAKANTPPMRMLRERLRTIELRPFDEKATLRWVTGLFGDVAAVPRLAMFLLEHAAGNPRAYTDVVQHLIGQGFIRYAEGTWVLPDELPAVGPDGLDLRSVVAAAFEDRIASWTPALRALAHCLSPHRRSFDLTLCREVAAAEPELAGKSLQPLLDGLVREGVLVEDHGTYAFTRSRIRSHLYAHLDDAQRRERHGRIANALIKTVGTEQTRGFEIGFHLVLSGDLRRAHSYMNRTVEASLTSQDLLIEAVPDLWELLEQQRSAGASDEDVQFIEGLLVLSGYYLDPTVHDRFGDRVLVTMHRTMGFELAARLAPKVGRTLGLLAGMTVAWWKMLFRKPYLVSGNSFLMSIIIFVSVCASQSGGGCFRLDKSVHARLRELLALASGLSRFNSFRLLYDLFGVGAQVVQGRHREALEGLQDQLARLPRVLELNAQSKHQYEAGLQFFVGRNHLLRLDSNTLQAVERSEKLGARHDRLMAHFLRMTYHLYRGDLTSVKREQDRYDELSALFGARWTAEMMGVLEFIPYHLAGDVLGLKRMLHRIERLLPIAPGLSTSREVIRAMYEGHRGRPDLALQVYNTIDAQLAPFTTPMWSLARAHQAECLNTLGRRTEALAICEAALARIGEADRIYVFAYQQLEREAAIALAGLGRLDDAVRLIDRLIAECARYDNPLISGLLHHDRARIACIARDVSSFEQHAEAARAAFAPTGYPALIARARRLLELGRSSGLVATLPSFQEEANAGFGLVRNARAERILEEVVQHVGARAAALYLVMHGRAVLSAQFGESQRLSVRAVELEVARIEKALVEDVDMNPPSLVLQDVSLSRVRRIVPLVTSGERQQLVAMLVLGDCDAAVDLAPLEIAQLASELVSRDEDTEVAEA